TWRNHLDRAGSLRVGSRSPRMMQLRHPTTERHDVALVFLLKPRRADQRLPRVPDGLRTVARVRVGRSHRGDLGFHSERVSDRPLRCDPAARSRSIRPRRNPAWWLHRELATLAFLEEQRAAFEARKRTGEAGSGDA